MGSLRQITHPIRSQNLSFQLFRYQVVIQTTGLNIMTYQNNVSTHRCDAGQRLFDD